MLKDARGNKSITVTLILGVYVIVIVKFLASGSGLPVIGTEEPIDLQTFCNSILTILAAWIGREGIQKHHERNKPGQG